jgi:FtsP/CotA-like multicopper oxidase with cupredoxin domain
MKRPMLLMVIGLALVVAAMPWEIDPAYGNGGPVGAITTYYANSPLGIIPAGTKYGAGNNTGTPLRKFFDKLPGLGAADANLLGQYIPVANPDTLTYPNSDYYEIVQKEFRIRMHTDLPAPTDALGSGTKLRGYYQVNTGTTGPTDNNERYLGPLIIARTYDTRYAPGATVTTPTGSWTNGKPVRLKIFNQLATGAAGNLFIPVDTTLMGAGPGPGNVGTYTQNRTSVHLHGGMTPWISDGTPYQWFTPAGEAGPYLQGASFHDVPDMASPGAGATTHYYTNQQSGRLMFYHDHAIGITRLNVYAGLAAGYLIVDAYEDDLIDGTNNTGINPTNAKAIPDQADLGPLYKYGIPLIIQDRTFVPADIATEDSAWSAAFPGGGTPGAPGDLWFPHYYETNQTGVATGPNAGANPVGRWDYGPWFWPPQIPTTLKGPLPNPTCVVPEGFMDTPIINGCAYPYLVVQPKAYRFRILNACNDRNLNLSLFTDATGGGSGAAATATLGTGTLASTVASITMTNGGSGFQTPPGVLILGGGGFGATATATISGPGGIVTGITVTYGGSGYTSTPTVYIGGTGEVKMVPAQPTTGFPAGWPTDQRAGGTPDPATSGPSMIQIGTEGGVLAAPAVIPPQPVNYEYNRRNIVVLNVLEKALFMGPAERADIIVDFSAFAGRNVILYNDAPAPVPAFDPRYDYYSGGPDNTDQGGAPQTMPGFGPNTRTIMQFQVAAAAPAVFDPTPLNTTIPAAFKASQPEIVVPQAAYGPAYGTTLPDVYSSIQATSLTFTPVNGLGPMTMNMQAKNIQELFDDYGRMNATLGTELPLTNFNTQTTVVLKYIDPPTENVIFGQPQLWKITHNGVDTHSIHFHLWNVQIVNRVGWDGAVRAPDPNEIGWKETVRMHPLEDCIVAIKPIRPIVPFSVPDSVRLLDPNSLPGTTVQFSNIDPYNGTPITTVNQLYNFGWEYVWHCHLLGHEENDMMRPIKVTGTAVPQVQDFLLLE